MKIEEFIPVNTQMSRLGKSSWSVARLLQLSKSLKVMDIPIDHLNVYYKYDDLTLREMVTHIKAVNEANLDYPIILDEDGELMDGRHRIMKALLNGEKTIKAVRFDENPRPCEVAE
jgi:hypothetical protein